jgi:hypothetical protein
MSMAQRSKAALLAIATVRTRMSSTEHNLLKPELRPEEALFGTPGTRVVTERPPMENAKFFMDPATCDISIVSTLPQAEILRSRGFRECKASYFFPSQTVPFRTGAAAADHASAQPATAARLFQGRGEGDGGDNSDDDMSECGSADRDEEIPESGAASPQYRIVLPADVLAATLFMKKTAGGLRALFKAPFEFNDVTYSPLVHWTFEERTRQWADKTMLTKNQKNFTYLCQAYVALVMSESNKNIPDAQVLNHVALRTTGTDIRNSSDVAVSELNGWYFKTAVSQTPG